MKFTGTFIGAKLDLQEYKSRLQDHLWRELKLAANAWLTGTGGRVPVWSGMARGSLLELNELINGTIVIAPLRVPSRISQGRSLGTAIPESSSELAQITITTNVEHYNIQEHSKVASGGSPSAPWKSFEAGAVAFKAAASLAKLPPLRFKPKVHKV
ncbi:hypothetical protein LCGC14_2289490 [marine sediment metagenome]|uniref:Uncharacterized protein n=1 Tax=marine sediment metagenome TaxID=412755 RepID=A0A0F9FLU7_9ZZZZ